MSPLLWKRSPQVPSFGKGGLGRICGADEGPDKSPLIPLFQPLLQSVWAICEPSDHLRPARASSCRRKPASRRRWNKAPGSQLHNLAITVSPGRVALLDQFDLPRALPFLDPLLPCNRADHRLVNLEPDQPGHSVALGETFDDTIPVLPHARHEVRRAPGVPWAISRACQNVDTRLLHLGPLRPRAACVCGGRKPPSRNPALPLLPAWMPAFAGMTHLLTIPKHANSSAQSEMLKPKAPAAFHDDALHFLPPRFGEDPEKNGVAAPAAGGFDPARQRGALILPALARRASQPKRGTEQWDRRTNGGEDRDHPGGARSVAG